MTSPIPLDAISKAVNVIAQREAQRHGLGDEMMRIELVPGLKSMMVVDMHMGPTIRVQLAWPESASAPVLNAQIRAAIHLILKHSRPQFGLVPMSFVRIEQEREGKRRMAWKRGNVWEDITERIPGLIPRERIQIEHRSVTIYRDVMTGAEVERRSSYKRMHTKSDDISGWLELSSLVREQHPESMDDDTIDEAESITHEESHDETTNGHDSGNQLADNSSKRIELQSGEIGGTGTDDSESTR